MKKREKGNERDLLISKNTLPKSNRVKGTEGELHHEGDL